jgi:peroxiredoxin family protein
MTANRLRDDRHVYQPALFDAAADGKIDIPPIPEFIELLGDSGAHFYACQANVDMFGLTMEDFVHQVEAIISVGEF